MMAARRSLAEWRASERMLMEPVASATAVLATTNVVLEATERAAARVLVLEVRD
jgi:hypothetical protein